jgi:HUS1 checkpoint protein
VNILLPSLNQLRTISDRFTKLALADRTAHASISGLTASGPKLVLSANMHGCLRLGIQNDAMSISTTWTGLVNPELNPAQVEGGEESIRNHPTERMRRLGDKEGNSEEGWAKVRIDGRDWMRVMSVGRLGAEKVIACECFTLCCCDADWKGFCDDHALILYVFMDSGTMSDNSVLTV